MSCYPPGSFTHSLLLSQNTPCNRSLIVVASRQGMQMLTRCCQSGKWGGKRSLSCYKHDRAWSAATGVSRRTSLCFMAAVLTDKGLSSAENSHNDLKKTLWNVASSFTSQAQEMHPAICLAVSSKRCPSSQEQVLPCWAAAQDHRWLLRGCARCKGLSTASARNLILFSADINWALPAIICLCTFQSVLSQSLGLMILW